MPSNPEPAEADLPIICECGGPIDCGHCGDCDDCNHEHEEGQR